MVPFLMASDQAKKRLVVFAEVASWSIGFQFGSYTGTFRVCIMDEREQGFVQAVRFLGDIYCIDETCIV